MSVITARTMEIEEMTVTADYTGTAPVIIDEPFLTRGLVNITYDPSVISVISVDKSDFEYVSSWRPEPGVLMIDACGKPRCENRTVLAIITFGSSSEETVTLPVTGTIWTSGVWKPVPGRSCRLMINVTDDSGVASVIVDLMEFGLSNESVMSLCGGDIYRVDFDVPDTVEPGLKWVRLVAADYEGLTTTITLPIHVLTNGDVNGDGVVGLGDVVLLLNYIMIGGYEISSVSVADVNADSMVSIGDVVLLLNHVMCPSEYSFCTLGT